MTISKQWKNGGRLAIVAASLAVLAGCVLGPVADPTRFYLFNGTAYEPVSEAGSEESVVIGLTRINVATYLDSPGISIRERGNQVAYSQLHRWAESIEKGVGRMVSENLHQEPAIAHVVGYPVQRRPAPDYDLHLSILRAEGVLPVEGVPHAAFVATWELRAGPDGDLLESGRVNAENVSWDGEDFDELARGLSLGVNELTQQVVRAVVELRAGD